MLKLLKNDHIFSIFSRFRIFPQVFRHVNEWPILQLLEMITVLHVGACPIVFVWFYDRDWQGVVLKLRSFIVF